MHENRAERARRILDEAYRLARGEPSTPAVLDEARRHVRHKANRTPDNWGLVYKTHAASAPAIPEAPLVVKSMPADASAGWDAWLRSHLDNERRLMVEIVGQALGELIAKRRKEARAELQAEVNRLNREVEQLRDLIIELRRDLRADRAQIIDLPSPLQPRRVN
jgi:hypothetical protein